MGSKWTEINQKWTKLDQMDRSEPNRIELTKMDRIGLKWI